MRILILAALLLLGACGSDERIKSVEMGSQKNITCSNRADGFYYWETRENQCSVNCYSGQIWHINCWAR